MIDQQDIDFAATKALGSTLIQLSHPQELPWSGIQSLAPFESIELAEAMRHDLYIINGTLHEAEQEHPTGSFLRRVTKGTLVAGAEGSLLFIHRDAKDVTCKPETISDHDLDWLSGYPDGMGVAYLADAPHSLMLVSWQPGTRVRTHTHPYGEEILVLKGELRDEKGAYPAGCWLRFSPGSGHAPYAEQETLILLRNGHLL